MALATFQVLTGHIQLVATVLGRSVVRHVRRWVQKWRCNSGLGGLEHRVWEQTDREGGFEPTGGQTALLSLLSSPLPSLQGGFCGPGHLLLSLGPSRTQVLQTPERCRHSGNAPAWGQPLRTTLPTPVYTSCSGGLGLPQGTHCRNFVKALTGRKKTGGGGRACEDQLLPRAGIRGRWMRVGKFY